MQNSRKRVEPAIGELFNQDGVARLRYRCQHHGHRMLDTAGNDDLIGMCFDAFAFDPVSAGLDLPVGTTVWLVVEQDRPPPRARRRKICSNSSDACGRGWKVVGAKVGDYPLLRDEAGCPGADKGSPPYFTYHQSPALRLGIATRNRSQRDTERIGELAMSRQPITRLEISIGHTLSDRLG